MSDRFFSASPIYAGPAVYSIDRIQKEFIHVLCAYSNGKMTVAEVGTFLGLDEQHVKTVGDTLCETQDVMKVEGGYALKRRMLEKLVESINLHCSDSYATFEAMSAGGGTVQQLSTELSLELQDVLKMLREIFDDKGSFNIDPSIVLVKDESNGEIVEVANQKTLGLKKKHFEQHILSALSGITVPVSVSYDVHKVQQPCASILTAISHSKLFDVRSILYFLIATIQLYNPLSSLYAIQTKSKEHCIIQHIHQLFIQHYKGKLLIHSSVLMDF